MHSVRLLYYEILKPFPESNRDRLRPATERLFVVNVKMGPYIYTGVLYRRKRLYTSIFIRTATVRPTQETPTLAPVVRPNTVSTLFDIGTVSK